MWKFKLNNVKNIYTALEETTRCQKWWIHTKWRVAAAFRHLVWIRHFWRRCEFTICIVSALDPIGLHHFLLQHNFIIVDIQLWRWTRIWTSRYRLVRACQPPLRSAAALFLLVFGSFYTDCVFALLWVFSIIRAVLKRLRRFRYSGAAVQTIP